MKKSSIRQATGLITLLLACQLLSACIVLPVPPRRYGPGVVVEVGPGHGHLPPPRGYYRDRDWRH